MAGITLIRGPMLDWYPYEILDVPGMGYHGISAYVLAILGVYLALVSALWGIDRLIARRNRN